MNLKDRIIHESLRLFSLKGFLSTSIHDILEATHTSKGGLYNHFSSKEALFLAVLSEAQRIWRDRNLAGLHQIENPLRKITKLLENYKDRYLKDTENFPGGCIFVTLSVELDDQRPHLAAELNKGFSGFKDMLKRLLDQAKASGSLEDDVDTEALTGLIFSGMLGASVIYGTEKSVAGLDQCINALIGYIESLAPYQASTS
jgi:TetR/AcrR family transcriptional repressor of nem operon